MPVTERNMSPELKEETKETGNPTFELRGQKYEITPVWQLYMSNFLSDLERHVRRRVITQLLPSYGVTADFEAAKQGFSITTLAEAIHPVLETLENIRIYVQTAFQPPEDDRTTSQRHEILSQLLQPVSQGKTPTPQQQYDHATEATLSLLHDKISGISPSIRLSTNYIGLQIDLDEIPSSGRNQEYQIQISRPLEQLTAIISDTHLALRGRASFYTSEVEQDESIKNLQEGLSLVNKHIAPLGAKYNNTPEDSFLLAYEENMKALFRNFNASLTKGPTTEVYAPSVGFLLSTQGLAELPLDSPRMAASALPEKPSCLLLSELNIFMITLEHHLNMGDFEDMVTTTARQYFYGRKAHIAPLNREEKFGFQLATRKMSDKLAAALDAVEALIRTESGYSENAPQVLQKAGILNLYPPPGLRQ